MIETDKIATAVARVTLRRPEALNALNKSDLAALAEAVGRFSADKEVKVIILTGCGEKAFCAGGDVKAYRGMTASEAYENLRLGQQAVQALEAAEVPVIAAINGLALGGGFELALGADMRIAASHAVFGLPEVRLGLFPGWGGTQRTPGRIGRTRAAELLFTGETIDAGQALAWGLVNRIVPQEQLETAAAEYAAKLSGMSREVLVRIKRMLGVADSSAGSAALELERTLLAATFELPDAREGIAAFAGKRKPIFRH